MKKFISFDTEDDGKANPFIIDFFDGEKHYTFTGKNCKSDAINFILISSVNLFIAHNLEYDLMNLAFPLYIDLFDFYYNSGRLLFAKIKDTRKKFVDSFNFSFTSIKSIGINIGLNKLETKNGNFNDIEYCRRDAEICWQYMADFNRKMKQEFDLNPKITLAGTAQTTYLRRFLDYKYKQIKGQNCNLELLKAYYGGRCEVFRNNYIENYVFEVDINSCYPYVMREKFYPTSEGYETIEPIEEFFVANIKVKIRDDVKYPIICKKHDNKLLFPVGVFETWTTSMEILEANKYNQIESIEYIKTINFSEVGKIFEDFVNYFYEKRKLAKKRGKQFESNFYKLILNSTYGRFALTKGLQILNVDEKYNYHYEDVLIDDNKSKNYSIALFVTAYGRIELFRMIMRVLKLGAIPLYSDTDSCYFCFDKKIDLQDTIINIYNKLPINSELGSLSLAVYKYGIFVNAKQYILVDFKLDDKIKCKGIPKENRKEFFEEGKTSYKRPVKLRTFLHSIDKNFIPNFWKDFLVYKRSGYKKRIVLQDGDTIPLKFKEEE